MEPTARNLPVKAPARSANASQRDTRAERVAILTSCLALVRPAGMSADDVEDWIGVALGEVLDMPLLILSDAAAEARKSCTHHAQIIPAIFKAAAGPLAYKRSIDRFVSDMRPALPAPPIEPLEDAAAKLRTADAQRAASRRVDFRKVKIEPGPMSAKELVERWDSGEAA